MIQLDPVFRVSRASSRYRQKCKFVFSKPSQNIPEVFWALLDHFGWSRIQPRGQNPTESIFRKLYCFWSETWAKAVRSMLFFAEILLKPVQKKCDICVSFLEKAIQYLQFRVFLKFSSWYCLCFKISLDPQTALRIFLYWFYKKRYGFGRLWYR